MRQYLLKQAHVIPQYFGGVRNAGKYHSRGQCTCRNTRKNDRQVSLRQFLGTEDQEISVLVCFLVQGETVTKLRCVVLCGG